MYPHASLVSLLSCFTIINLPILIADGFFTAMAPLRRSPRTPRGMALSSQQKTPFRIRKQLSSVQESPEQKKRPKSVGTKVKSTSSPKTPDLLSTITSSHCTTIQEKSPVILSTRQAFSNDGWTDFRVPPAELRPSATLTTGQCFHWKAVDDAVALQSGTSSAWGTHNATQWIGTVRIDEESASAVLLLREQLDRVQYKVLREPFAHWDAESFLREYFQLDSSPSLSQLYQDWSRACPRLRRIAECVPGVRIIDQDPWECLVSFLCSSNNNIPRITKMLQAIRREYGEPLVQLVSLDDEKEFELLNSFPSLRDLHEKATDQDLRQRCGMGYRAKYLLETMDTLIALGGESYLHSLRRKSDPVEVQEALLQFCGVGRKVADCIALFSLQQNQSIPVDVHVWDIARRDYDSDHELKQQKSLTPSVYRQVGDVFRDRFPSKSGWAHSLLFVAELPSFRSALPEDMLEQMDQVGRKGR